MQLSLLVAGLACLLPAWRASRSHLAGDLKERGSLAAGGRGRAEWRFALVAGEIALSVVALTGASLFLRSLSAATGADPGFDAGHVGIVVFDAADNQGNHTASSPLSFGVQSSHSWELRLLDRQHSFDVQVAAAQESVQFAQ